jgi:glycosyltransferase involved in cell wall biosynthesis
MTTTVVQVDGSPVPPATPANLFVIPAFNEADNVPRLLADLEARPELFPAGSRLILVDDGSSDDTVAVARAYRGSLPLEVLELGVNQGPGGAFRAGFAAALEGHAGDALVVTLESDTTSDLAALAEMLRRARDGADLVLASVHNGGRMLNVSAPRRVLSRGAGMVVRRALDLDAMTVSSFFRVYRASILVRGREAFGDDFITERGFACKAEILAKLVALGARVEEVTIDLDASLRVGESKMRLLPTLAGYMRLVAARRRIARAAR